MMAKIASVRIFTRLLPSSRTSDFPRGQLTSTCECGATNLLESKLISVLRGFLFPAALLFVGLGEGIQEETQIHNSSALASLTVSP